MPGYVNKAMQRFNVTPSATPTESGTIDIPYIKRSSQPQLPTTDTTPLLDANDTKFIQQVCGVFLYYSRAVDPTMLTPISKISPAQANPTAATLAATHKFLQYAASHPDASIT